MQKLFRFSLKQVLLLFTVIAVVLGMYVVPKYRRYADFEYLAQHPAIKCFSSVSNNDPGLYAYLGIKKRYEEIDDLRIQLAELVKESELEELLAAIDRNASIRTLWIHAEGGPKEINLSKFFANHDFEKFALVNFSLKQDQMPEKVMQAKALYFYHCLLQLNEKPFRCDGFLDMLNCSIASDCRDVGISADHAVISFDQMGCNSLTIELRGQAKASVMLTKKSDSLKSIKMVGTADALNFDGMDDEGEAAEISLDISALHFRHAIVRKVKEVLFKKIPRQELHLDDVENEVELK